MGESGLQEALFAELAAGAGVRAYGVPSHAGGLPANTGEHRGGQKWTNARFRPIRGWANRRLGVPLLFAFIFIALWGALAGVLYSTIQGGGGP